MWNIVMLFLVSTCWCYRRKSKSSIKSKNSGREGRNEGTQSRGVRNDGCK